MYIIKKIFFSFRKLQFSDVPLRVIGRISGTLNGIEFPSRDLQCYVQTKDGRTYTALSSVPEEIGASFQLLGNLGGVIGWLFAKPISDTENGYELTGKKRSRLYLYELYRILLRNRICSPRITYPSDISIFSFLWKNVWEREKRRSYITSL